MQSYFLVGALIAVAVVSFVVSPRVRTADGFFRGFSDTGGVPGVWTLTLSQVTTWIFARSLLNAAILGYAYGIAGTLAYAAYYLSFLTGGLIIDRLRFVHGHGSIQSYLDERFGRLGTVSYNFVVALRLLSEVFANLIVVGIVFGATGSVEYTGAVVVVALMTLGYSMLGGLRASLRTDVLQMWLFLVALVVVVALAMGNESFDVARMMTSSPDLLSPGWVLLIVALLQVTSYPMHDPVMMDRGFLADRDTTRKSFLYACALSLGCIVAFGLLGVFAGLEKVSGEDLLATLERLLGAPAMLLVSFTLVVSAVSTLDSTFAASAKLVVVDMKAATPTTRNGRIAMALCFAGGLAFLFLGNDDLFAAVAVSGTAALFLAPVIVCCIWGGWRVAPWAYLVSFLAAIAAAALYFLESGNHITIMTDLTGLQHKYSHLLVLTAIVLIIGFAAFVLGRRKETA